MKNGSLLDRFYTHFDEVACVRDEPRGSSRREDLADALSWYRDACGVIAANGFAIARGGVNGIAHDLEQEAERDRAGTDSDDEIEFDRFMD